MPKHLIVMKAWNNIKAMKRVTLIIAMIVFAIIPAVSQRNGGKGKEAMHREMQEYKLRFLSQEMNLTADQQKKFEELYVKMSAERRQLFHATREQERKVRNNANASEADYKAAVNAMRNAKEKDAQIEKKYDAQFAKFLTARQIYKLKEAEETFNRRMRSMHKKSREKKSNNKRVYKSRVADD